MSALLSLQNITSGYGSMQVLHDVSLDVEERQIVSLLGPNGSGKTTVLRTIFGVIQPWQGKVLFRENDISGTPPDRVARMGICYVPQEGNIFPNLTVKENLEMGAYLRTDDIRGTLEEVYEFFPALTNRRKSRAGELSGGMRQMLAIGRAMMMNPALLMLDEPSTGLAPNLVDQIFENIRDLNKTGMTIFLVEQNAQALGCSDHSYILEGGEKRAEGKASDLAKDEDIGRMYLGR